MFAQIYCSVATITFRQRPGRMCWLARVTALSPHRLRMSECPSCGLSDGNWYLAVAQCTCDVPHADKFSGKIVTSPTLPLMIEGWSLLTSIQKVDLFYSISWAKDTANNVITVKGKEKSSLPRPPIFSAMTTSPGTGTPPSPAFSLARLPATSSTFIFRGVESPFKSLPSTKG